ncbi:hypothetical protein J7E73_10210 [Paenibacillus albidus]|uniref:hypothetical protein n=1 Tax=Paenibacillus albidus TaxID=2041023 RepID=UPI001BED3150|nr:hypothetical protein [Paenibacillus albidus]MBT2289498.1 hypothetical protein [Paenibacillus albidus]
MRTIQTQQDLTSLSSSILNPPFLSHIENYFSQLKEMHSDTEDTLFSLQKHGYIVILEPGDNLYDLSIVGLNPEDAGLLGSSPEYVEAINLNGLTLYKIVVMYTDDYLMTFFTLAGWHDDIIERWLRQEAGIGWWADELIADKLRNLFERNDLNPESQSGSNVWVALAATLSINEKTPTNMIPDYAQPFTFDSDPFSLSNQPTHIVRTVLRTTDLDTGTNEYVDGNTFLFRVNEETDQAELMYEEEAFGDTPGFQGGNIPDAYRWVCELTKPFYIRLKDSFLTSAQRILLNGHDQDEPLPDLTAAPVTPLASDSIELSPEDFKGLF